MKYSFLKKLSFGLLLILPITLSFATIIEKIYGREIALREVYHSVWFICLWALLAISGFLYLFFKQCYRKPISFILHLSLLIILAGGFITYLTAERGFLHLREGKPASSYTTEDELHQQELPFEVKLVYFTVKHHHNSSQPADFISFIRINNEKDLMAVSMNKIYSRNHYRLYQLSYDSDERGSILLVYHDPWGIAITYSGYLLLAASMLWLLFVKIKWKGVLILFVVTAIFWLFISQIHPMTPILRTPMLALHVSVIMVSYVLLLIIAVLSAVGLYRQEKCDKMYAWSSTLLYPALMLLAYGIFIGAVWANISWGRYWGWDSKETWALITMLVYAFPLHKGSISFFSEPKKFCIYCLAAFLSVLMTFVGVSFLLSGMHSYISN